MADDRKSGKGYVSSPRTLAGGGVQASFKIEADVLPRGRFGTTDSTFSASGGPLDEQIDSCLDSLEAEAKLLTGAISFVKREKKEFNFLFIIEKLLYLLERVVQKDDRDALVSILGAPYTRLARMHYLVETVPLSERRVQDARWTDLYQSVLIAEAVLKDLDPKKFRSWRQLKEEGLFVPAFEDSEAGSDPEEIPEDVPAERKSSTARHVLELKGLQRRKHAATFAEEYFAEDKEGIQSRGRAESQPVNGTPISKAASYEDRAPGPFRFARHPLGKHAHVMRDGTLLTRLAEQEDQNALAQMVDSAAMAVMKTGSQGSGVGRHMFHYGRKLFTTLSDSGCTAISETPIGKFPGIGQYAEMRIEAVREASPLGCFGIGITTIQPKSWGVLYKPTFGKAMLPKSLSDFPSPSWILTGPYKGAKRKMVVNGMNALKYAVSDEDSRWKTGDLVGLLVRLDGRLTMYCNGKEIVTAAAAGLQEHAAKSNLYLVCEAFGYVVACSLVQEVDPSKLDLGKAQASGKLMNRLSVFLS